MLYLRFFKIRRIHIAALALSCIFVSNTSLLAQTRITSTDPELRMEWYDKHEAMKDRSIFKDLRWQFVGPTNISGRSTDVAVATPYNEHYTVFMAAASGGVWRTTNDGTTWEPVFEQGPSTSIGDVTIAPSDNNIVWIGTGEANIFRSSMAGAGVFKSTDGGDTWEHKGLVGTHTIPRIVIHPTNPDIVYVAASGHEWTDNEERGVYKSANGGDSWEKILYIDEKTGIIDLVMDPEDSNILYAATWQRIRKRWNDPRSEEGYTGSGIHKTTDGGRTWQAINDGLPRPDHRGRIGIDVSQSNPNVLYAFVDNYETGPPPPPGTMDSYGRPMLRGRIKGSEVYRSDNKGGSWRLVSTPEIGRFGATYGWVFGQIRVDPNDEDKIYVMGLGLNVSEDAGKTFRRLRGMHGDHHALWIDPDNSDFLVNGNDGGIYFSYDGGENWRFNVNIPAVQFFNINYDMEEPFHVYGSIQDHGSRRGVVDLNSGRNRFRGFQGGRGGRGAQPPQERVMISPVEFENAPGGEGSSHAIDPVNTNIVYSASFYGRITRTDLSMTGAGRTKNIIPVVFDNEPALRGQWLAPFIISPHNRNIIYHGMQYLFRSRDRGDTWEKISPDLTYNDPKKIGDISYQTIFTLSESPLKYGVIYAGTDDGKIHLAKDRGSSWKEIMDGLPYNKWVSRIIASAHDLGTVYMAQNGKRDDDFAPYLWKSTDFGETWQSIVGNIPIGPINVIREDPNDRNGKILYVGTDIGVYVTIDGGETWNVLANNLPSTFVSDLIIHPRDNVMVISTHGRGIWALDVQPIQNYQR